MQTRSSVLLHISTLYYIESNLGLIGVTPESKVAAESLAILDEYLKDLLDPENTNFDL